MLSHSCHNRCPSSLPLRGTAFALWSLLSHSSGGFALPSPALSRLTFLVPPELTQDWHTQDITNLPGGHQLSTSWCFSSHHTKPIYPSASAMVVLPGLFLSLPVSPVTSPHGIRNSRTRQGWRLIPPLDHTMPSDSRSLQ